MSDRKSDGRATRPSTPRANPFVRRLIPTVAAATLTFSACGPETGSNNGNGGTNNDDTNNGNNVTQNNTAPNNTTPNNTTPNNTTPNNTTPNNTTPNNTTTNNTTNNTNGTFVFDVVDGDGTLSVEELRSFCQAWSDCDADAFQASYDSVDDCAQEQQTYLETTLQTYEDEYGADCSAAYEAYMECYTGAWACIGGLAGPEQTAEEQCYETFDPDIETHCQ